MGKFLVLFLRCEFSEVGNSKSRLVGTNLGLLRFPAPARPPPPAFGVSEHMIRGSRLGFPFLCLEKPQEEGAWSQEM